MRISAIDVALFSHGSLYGLYTGNRLTYTDTIIQTSFLFAYRTVGGYTGCLRYIKRDFHAVDSSTNDVIRSNYTVALGVLRQK